ncbi:MAG: hypothetical protein IJW84_02205 [Alphaproteobacteria bacterium]|nr:hypothetical protein [Alphaproteobacteria bacterium]
MYVNVAWGLSVLPGTGTITPTLCYTIPDEFRAEGCSDTSSDPCTSQCASCNGTTTSFNDAITTTRTEKTTVTGVFGAMDSSGNFIDGCTLHCECVSSYTYTCRSGYYGTATSMSTGCTACPDNATCAGGNGSTFVCDEGFRKSGSSCIRCGTNQTSNADRTACECISGYYLFKSACVECPTNTLACGPGATVGCLGGYYRSSGTGGYSCNRCPTITDSDTGYAVYTNSALSTAAYGASTQATSISGCYWMTGTYYDKTGTIAIGAGASGSTCQYSTN